MDGQYAVVWRQETLGVGTMPLGEALREVLRDIAHGGDCGLHVVGVEPSLPPALEAGRKVKEYLRTHGRRRAIDADQEGKHVIIGISGRKQAGKSGLAQFLVSQLSGAVAVNFADPLKDLAAKMLGATPAQLHGTEEDRARPLACGLPARAALQKLAMELRALDGQSLVRAWTRQVCELWATRGACPIVTADVRMPDEAERIHEMGGLVIRLTRAPHLDDADATETALDGWAWAEPDLVIENAGMPENAVWRLALEKVIERGIVP